MSDFFKAYGPWLLTIVQLLLAWALWSMRREFTTQKDCEFRRQTMTTDRDLSRDKLSLELKKPVAKTEDDLEQLRLKVERLPDRTEMQEFSREIGEMNKTLGKLEGRLHGINRAVDLMNQYLINKHGD